MVVNRDRLCDAAASAPRGTAAEFETAMTLADLVAPGSGELRLRFADEPSPVDHGMLCRAGESRRCQHPVRGQPAVTVLINARACATVLIGGIAAGQPLVSVPMTPRSTDPDGYLGFLESVCALPGASTSVADAALVPLVPPMERVTCPSLEEADSLDLLELTVFLEQERDWSIPDNQMGAQPCRTVGDLARLVIMDGHKEL